MELDLLAESGDGKLYSSNGFLVPVLTGTSLEMGRQYGELMAEHMQKSYDVLVAPGVASGAITDDDAHRWSERAYSTCSSRYRGIYDGVMEATGWSLQQVGLLDHYMEYGIYQSKIHSFAGCTSIASWSGHSADGGMYIGRNEDWSETFNKFAQVVTVWRPTDGSYRWANVGWPGMYFLLTAINEHGVYVDLHDGTSMGGSVVYVDRASILGLLTDAICDTSSAMALVRRLQAVANSTSVILTVADEDSAASMECSSLGGNRLRLPDDGDSLVVVNTFLNPDWGLAKRETISNSLRRFDNMTARLADHAGEVDAKVTRDVMDLTLFDSNGEFAKNGGCTKPTKIDADSTVHQTVCDVHRRQLWVKVPNPDYFADWTHLDLNSLWS